MCHDEWGRPNPSPYNNKDSHDDLLSAYYLQDTILSALYLLTHLNLKTSLYDGYCNYFNFTLRKSR